MFFVMYQGCPSHILSMPSIEQLYTLGTLMDIGENTNKILPSKEGGKYLTSHACMLSKLVVLKSDLDLLLDFVNFNVLTILKPKQDGDN